MNKSGYRVFLCLFFFIFSAFLSGYAAIEPEIFKGLKVRSIGPANMSGRIAAVAAVESNPNIIYVGTATGGVWKSTDGGITWEAVFDEQPVASIGALAIHPLNPNLIWVGTGETGVRNSAGVGRGVYLTPDGGKTWKFLGLEKTERISRILLDPLNPDVAYVGAMGTAWGENPERGVYKTEDSGKTWKNILYVDEKTGAADLAMDPENPNKLLAAMWQYRRWPWFFKSGGPGSGLYISVDGGENWQKLSHKNGFPSGELGRIGIAFAPNRPEIAYALVEAEKSVFLRSEDGGWNWQVVNNEEGIHDRPFYYSGVVVNPANENTVYFLQTRLRVSEDGGKSFRSLASFTQSHSDYHAMWIHPDGDYMVVGNDGGVVISRNRGESWRFMPNLPLGQFYHIGFDFEIPYNIYGGLQDNGSWMGPAYTLTERSAASYLWKTIGGGDGFNTQPDPENPGAGYGMSQGGNLYYFDTQTGTSRNIVPTESEVKHRFNWNAGFAMDPFEPSTIYLGSQFVHRSRDKGFSWEIISPDLTTNDPEKQRQPESGGLTLDVTNAENHSTILCIAPSPVQQGVIWVGTDDGNVQLTRNNGETWELVSKSLTTGEKGKVPPGTWVPHVEASKHDAATAYVCFDDHRRSNWTPYVYVTRDFGKTWKSLVTPEIDGFVHVIEEDPVNPNLLFLGTEFGLYVTFNGGGNWMRWSHDFPTVAVRDLAVHPRENDLIIGTHGRSIYVVDDISPLREIAAELLQKKLHLFAVPDSYQFIQGSLTSFMCPGDTFFDAKNKELGACFTYYLIPSEEEKKEKELDEQQQRIQAMRERMRQMGGRAPAGLMERVTQESKVSVEIMDKEGNLVASLKGTENKGFNRVYWDFKEQEPDAAEEERGFRFRRGGVTVLPDEYTVKIKYGDLETSSSFEVKTDPRLELDRSVLEENYRMAKAAQSLTKAVTDALQRIRDTQKSIQTFREFAQKNREADLKKLIKEAGALEEKLKEFSETLNPTPPKQGIADRSAGLRSQVFRAVYMIQGAGIHPINEPAKVKYQRVKAELEKFLEEFNQFFQEDVENFAEKVKESGFSLFTTYKPVELER
ncbi:MAG: WD40/YVTN/BNR-like repeat-containing protein [Acidobacteriota bacterium]